MENIKLKVTYLVLIAVVIFFAVNLIASKSLNKYEFDMTQESVFTLSEGSKKVLSGIDEPLKVTFFFSNKASDGIPVLKSYGTRIRALLEQYADNSDGMIKLQVIDPEPFSEKEDKAVSYGIKGIDIDQMGTKVYLGLAITNSIDDVKTIPFISPDKEKFLEYELTRAIYDLANPSRKTVGILSTIKMGSGPMLGIPGLGGSSWFVLQQISQMFETKEIDVNATKIPSDINVLMVVQPRMLNEETLYAIDQYVLGGGHAVFFVDPNKEGGGTGNPNDRGFTREINKLLNKWGVNVSPNRVIGDRMAARKYDKGADSENKWKYMDNVTWLELKGDNISRDDVTTVSLKTINMNTAGAIEPSEEGANTTVNPLIRTNKTTMKIPVFKVRNSPDVNEMLRGFVSESKEYNLAVRIRGDVQTAFPNKSGENHLSSSVEPINVVVVSDTDILRNENWSKTQEVQGYTVVSQFADNAAFVLNLMDNMTGSSELMNLRSKGDTKRPFVKVDELERKAQENYLNKENELKDRLARTEDRLAALKEQAERQAGSKIALKAEQQREITRFSDEMIRIRKELRNVQGELRKDIEDLGGTLKFINIWLMPILVVIFAFIIFYRKTKYSHSRMEVK